VICHGYGASSFPCFSVQAAIRAARLRSIGPLVSAAFCPGLFTFAVLVFIAAPSSATLASCTRSSMLSCARSVCPAALPILVRYGRPWRCLPGNQTIRLLADRICWTPRRDEGIYEYKGRLHYDRLLAGIVPAEKRGKSKRTMIEIVTEGMASPGGKAISYSVRKMASPTGARDTYELGPGEAYELPLIGTVRKAA
jgi:hypothetical protein